MPQERLPCRWDGIVQQGTWGHRFRLSDLCPFVPVRGAQKGCHSLPLKTFHWYTAVVLKVDSLLQPLIPSWAPDSWADSWRVWNPAVRTLASFCTLWCLRFPGGVVFLLYNEVCVCCWGFSLPPAGFIQNCALNCYFVSSRWRFFASTHVSECLWMDTNFLIFTIVFKHYLPLIP